MTLKVVAPPQQPHPNVLLYGPPKTGKTTGACSAPGGVLLLNLDLPNASHFARSKDTEGRISEALFEGFETLIDVTEVIGQETAKSPEARLINTIVVDTVGELHRRLLEETSKRAIRPTLQAYGDVNTHVERFCRWCCEQPLAAVFVCHEIPVRDDASGQFERLPWTGTNNPALGQKLLGMVDIVGYTGVIEGQDGSKTYAAQLISAGGRRGGDRFGVLGDGRELNLTEWWQTLGLHTPATPTEEERAA